MDVKGNEPVKKKSSNDVMRKKLEAELRATEEIARIKQNVIEKRLAVELASLEQEPPPIPVQEKKDAVIRQENAKPALHPAPKPILVQPEPRKPKLVKKPSVEKDEIPSEATSSAYTGVKLQKSPFSLRFRRTPEKPPKSTVMTPSFLTFSRKHDLPEFFMPLSPDDSPDEDEDDDEEEEEDDDQPKKRGSFLKGVLQKWKKRYRSEERERE